ncbi:DUF3152 domain-containing protein [Streptomyces sp. NPDC093097]|uniref:DUF3152 domain-containing protein n=1 Tax=Streptomyces sp. NPDC093097 TaxID=3366027 RepID=UPI003808E710
MGRHSRQSGAQGPAGEAAEPAGSTPYVPGTGRRRRRSGPAEGDGTVRGGHPEQHEAGGGWGATPARPAAARPAGAPSAPQMPAGVRIPRPRTGEPETRPAGPASGAPGTGTPAFGVPVASPDGGSGPRRDYVEAFDGPSAPPVPPVRAPRGVTEPLEQVPGGPAEAAPPVRPAGVDGFPADGDEVPPEDETATAARGGRKGGKARTLTGAAAAAVTTALAVVIAGQVAEQRQDSGGGPQPRSGDDRNDGGTDQAPRPQVGDAKAADYATQMTQVFPLDPQLTASGQFHPVGGDAKAPGHGKVLRYRVDMERGLPLDGDLFAEAVHKTLNDDRSWAHGGQRAFQRVGSGDADFVITLASPGTTAAWCARSGLDTTEDNVSCDSAATQRVMINAYRWAQGAKTYGPDKMLAYRQMLINHEVGHRLGHNHESCSRQGMLAPVMMQQTKFLTTDGVTCRPNSWPYPTGH